VTISQTTHLVSLHLTREKVYLRYEYIHGKVKLKLKSWDTEGDKWSTKHSITSCCWDHVLSLSSAFINECYD